MSFSPALHGFGGTTSMAAADFDGDGAVDLASVRGSTVEVRYGDGAGGLRASASFPTGGIDAFELVVADFDGDDAPDVATANVGSDDVSVLMGDGAGGLGAAELHGAGDQPVHLVAGDFGGDGEVDLAVSAYADDELLVLAGDGSGQFAAAVAHPVGDRPAGLAQGDFDGDGLDDVAVLREGSEDLGILPGRAPAPDGTVFESPVAVDTGAGIARIAAGNLDGDGRMDLGVVDQVFGDFTIIRGDAGRSFPATTRFGSSTVEDLAFADFNADGLDDLVLADDHPSDADDAVILSVGDGTGDFAFAGRFPTERAMDHVLAAELNGDAELDVVTAGEFGGAVLLGAALAFEPAEVEFPARRVGRAGSPISVTVENTGTVPYELAATGWLNGGAGEFAIAEDACTGVVLDVGATCALAVSFAASQVGQHEDVLVVETDVDAYGVAVLGEALPVPAVEVTPAAHAFPDTRTGRASSLHLSVSNTGEAPVAMGSVSLGGADPGEFALSADDCAGTTLEGFGSCSITVLFQPKLVGSRSATLVLEHDGQGGPAVVALSGTSTPVRVSRLVASAAAIDFGEVAAGTSATRDLIVRNDGPDATPVRLAISGPQAAAFRPRASCRQLAAGASCTVRIQFRPGSIGAHAAELVLSGASSRVSLPLAGTGIGRTPGTPDATARLRARLRAAVAAWRRGGLAKARRQGFVVKAVRAPADGALRLVIRTASRSAAAALVARRRVAVRAGAPVRIRARLTRAGRRIFRARRPLRLVATLDFTAAQDGRRSRARAVVRLR